MTPAYQHLLVMDIEASSLSKDSHPISIGVAGEGQRWIWFVTPLGEWEDWCEIAESTHGIDRDFLMAQGRDAFLVAREMNAVFKGQVLLINSDWDVMWINKLFDETGVKMGFSVKKLEEVIPPSICQSISDAFESTHMPHEADRDASFLREAIQAALRLHNLSYPPEV